MTSTNKLQEYNRNNYLLITNEHCCSAVAGQQLIIVRHNMVIGSITKSQKMVVQGVLPHAKHHGVNVTFRSDIDNVFDIGGQAKIYRRDKVYAELDGVTIWLLYSRGFIVYDFDKDRWEVLELAASMLGLELANISTMIREAGSVARH